MQEGEVVGCRRMKLRFRASDGIGGDGGKTRFAILACVICFDGGALR